jgi:ribosomal protein L23
MVIDPYAIVLYPFVTEKSMGHMEKNVNTRITKKGKHATVVFMPEYKAEDLGMRIGVF